MTTTLRPCMLCIAVIALVLGTTGFAHAKKCPADSVQVGAVCIDKYEASVWSTIDTKLIKRIQKGKIGAVTDLAGATAHGVAGDDYGAGCPDTGNGCMNYYAVSLVGVAPSAGLTWFQAAAACRNSGKRLATNQEWQMAAMGTPDPGTDNGSTDCNVGSVFTIVNAGSRTSCVSDVGAFDMVGNLHEWVADWGDRATACTNWNSTYGSDYSCAGDDGSANLPGALLRGGNWTDGMNAGVFAFNRFFYPSVANFGLGFRCAR